MSTVAVNLVGIKFGRLTVVKRAGSEKRSKLSRWVARCDCGRERLVTRSHLIYRPRYLGMTPSCGCAKRVREPALKAGDKLGRFTLIERVDNKTGGTRWLVRCRCGRETKMWTNNADRCRRECRTCKGSDLEYNGETHTVREWATKLGMTYQGLYVRLGKMPVDKALTLPKGSRYG